MLLMAMAITNIDQNADSIYPAADPDHERHEYFVNQEEEFQEMPYEKIAEELFKNGYSLSNLAETLEESNDYDVLEAEKVVEVLDGTISEDSVEEFKQSSEYSFEDVGPLLTGGS